MQRGSGADLWRQRFWRVEGMTRGKDMAGGADGRSSPPLPIVKEMRKLKIGHRKNYLPTKRREREREREIEKERRRRRASVVGKMFVRARVAEMMTMHVHYLIPNDSIIFPLRSFRKYQIEIIRAGILPHVDDDTTSLPSNIGEY